MVIAVGRPKRIEDAKVQAATLKKKPEMIHQCACQKRLDKL